jgi:hypothetical protein
MKTGQMLFVAVGGMLLGAGGTLAVQTGLVNYEVTLDIRPRTPTTVPPPNFQSALIDPYNDPVVREDWEPASQAQDHTPLTMPPLDDQQVAEIVTLREQIGSSVSQKLSDLTGSDEAAREIFADHLRAAAGGEGPPPIQSHADVCPLSPAVESSLARGLRDSQLR